MLSFTRLVLENFGPFRGRQVFEFPKNGVVFVYGENMRGKTTLLNAIRFALFGHVKSRAGDRQNVHELSNAESAEEGTYGFKVSLEFDYDGEPFRVDRIARPKAATGAPTDGSDYVVDCFLQKSGLPVSQKDREPTIQAVLPEDLARFFLFDGELLQEYEELLRSDSTSGPAISGAIEKILGMPVLTNAKYDVEQLLVTAVKQEARAASKHERTRDLGAALDELQDKLKVLVETRDGLETEIKVMDTRKTDLFQRLQRAKPVADLVREIELTRESISGLDREQLERTKSFKEAMKDSWRSILARGLSPLRETTQTELSRIQLEVTRRSAAQEGRRAIAAALEAGVCPTCNRLLDSPARERLSEQAAALGADDTFDVEREGALNVRLSILSEFEMDRSEQIASIFRDIDNNVVEAAKKRRALAELLQKMADNPEIDIQELNAEYEGVIALNARNMDRLKAARRQIEQLQMDIKSKLAEIARSQGNALQIEQQRRETYDKLAELFRHGVTLYRDRLKENVQKDATELFRSLTVEQEFDSLRINKNYGLVIIHKDGRSVPLRSAGAEHIVALSLLGALQKNAPLKGPIVMDSPFGRLDDGHTAKVVRALPGLSHQVVVLVYPKEIGAVDVQEVLGDSLKCEHSLVRVSAFNTRIAAC